MYSRDDDEALALATEFKQTFSTDVNIDFVGVWYDLAVLLVISADLLPQGHSL
jgi:hypothetical protein